MLTVEYYFRKTKYTWFIGDNWIMGIAFLLTMIGGIAYRRIKYSRLDTGYMSGTKGGAFIDECFEPESDYEITDGGFQVVVRRMLNLPPQGKPVVITVPLAILAYIVYLQPVKQITILGVRFYADRLKELALKTGLGIVGGSVFFYTPLGVVSVTGAILAIAIGASAVTGNFNCNGSVLKLAQEQLAPNRRVSFLELPENQLGPKVYIKGSEETEIYAPHSVESSSCSLETESLTIGDLEKKNIGFRKPTGKVEVLSKKCDRKYVPLKQRTKTLDDLRREDSTENREQATPYIERYQQRRERIRNRNRQ